MIWHAEGGLPIVELDELAEPRVITYKNNHQTAMKTYKTHQNIHDNPRR